MVREPGERYARATAVRDDIEHWLADEAVTAWSEPIITRIRRRLRPYRTAVAGVAAALVVATIGLAGFSLALQRQQRQTAAERNRAERARDVAFSAVQAIVLTDKDEMLAEENLPVRAILLDEGLRLSREMIKGAENDVRSQQLRAQALMMEAKILGAQGDRDRADESGKRAVEILSDRCVAPSDGANREWLAHLMYQYGTTARDPETRRSNALRSNEIYLRMLDQAPESGQGPVGLVTSPPTFITWEMNSSRRASRQPVRRGWASCARPSKRSAKEADSVGSKPEMSIDAIASYFLSRSMSVTFVAPIEISPS